MKRLLIHVSGTPPSAHSMAGAKTFARGMLPNRSWAASQPPRLPGVAHDFGPPAKSSSTRPAGFAADGAQADEVEDVPLPPAAARDRA